MNHNKTIRLAMVVSPYYEAVVYGMQQGAIAYLARQGVTMAQGDIFNAPGAFEIPLIAKVLARTGNYDGIICLGCVIKGETAHFEYICSSTAQGIMDATLETGIPISFGVLTTYTMEQAEARSLDSTVENKGEEAAAACFGSVQTLQEIRKLAKAA